MIVPIQALLAVCIFPIVLGSPLSVKNQDEDEPDLESTLIRSNFSRYSTPKRVVTRSDLRERYDRKLSKGLDQDDKFKNRRTTTNKSEAIGVTEIYMPKSLYLSRGYKPVYIYYVNDSTEEESSTQPASADDFENVEMRSSLHNEDETKSRSFSDGNTLEDGKDRTEDSQEESTNLKEKSDSDDSDEDEDEDDEDYDYENDEEYDGPEYDEHLSSDDSALSSSDEAPHPGHNKVCVHPRGNQNQEFHGQYPNQDYQGQYNNPGHYPDHSYQRQLSDAVYQKYIRGYQGHGSQGSDPYRGYQGPQFGNNNQGPYRGYQGPHFDNNQRSHPYHGYQGPHHDNNKSPHPYRGYQGPHFDNNRGSSYHGSQGPYRYRGYQGPHHDDDYLSSQPDPRGSPYHGSQGPYRYRGYQGPHHEDDYLSSQPHPRGSSPYHGSQGPYRYRGYQGPHHDNDYPSSQPDPRGSPNHGYQGPYRYRGYQGPHHDDDDYQSSQPDHRGSHTDRGHHGNSPNQNKVDPNCNHANTNLGRGSKEPENVVGSGQRDTFADVEKDNFSSGDFDDLDPEYDDDPDYQEDESEDSKDSPEVPLQSDIDFESKELSNKEIPLKDVISKKSGDLLNAEYLNDESSDPKTHIPNESNRGNNQTEEQDIKVIHKCLKPIQNEENPLKNATDATILDDCLSETIENAEGNKSGRLLDIFTRTNFSVECTTPKNESGQCKSFSECPIRNIMDNYNLFLQYMCLRGVFVGVCCPDNPVIETSDSDDDNTTGTPLDIHQPPEGCGLTQKTRIVGGQITAPHEWTWMVALMRRNRFFCGGVIINNWYILTAAHCVLGVNVKDLKVRLGEYNFAERTDHQHDIDVAEIKRHAMFVTATFQHDIALLKLKRRIEYSKFIGSICLPDTNARSYSDHKATVVGWGTVSFGGAASPILRQVTVPVWDNEDCDRTYFLERIDDSFLCAGSTENGEDACQGDSGGPLMTLNSDNRWEVIGIVSWGRRCGDPTYPGVYTRVTSYLEWIAAHSK